MSDYLFKKFHEIFGDPEIHRYFRAPGRINIIGEHVDYVGGKVLPAAINFYIHTIVSPTQTNKARLYSIQYDQFVEFELSEIKKGDIHWANYIAGVITEIKKIGHSISGIDMIIDGNIPEGAGLSSSAALEVVTGYAISETFGFSIPLKRIAILSQAAENNFIGVKCGIMDQFASAFGKKNHCILLDTHSLEYSYSQMNLEQYDLYLVNSLVKHSLKDSGYNQRRIECESALTKIQIKISGLKNLYELSPAIDLNVFGLTENEKKRVTHIIGEKQRTFKVIDALSKEDIHTFGRCLYEAHDSLSNLFEVSCQETDFIISFFKEHDTLGARMIGGGFGGCVLVVDYKNNSEAKRYELIKRYEKEFGIRLEIYKFEIADGTTEIQ